MKDKMLNYFKKPTAKSVIYYNQIKRPRVNEKGRFSENREVINFMFNQSIKGASKEGGKLKLI